MPVHDWTKVRAGTFHHFHHTWIARLCARLNGGVLPQGYEAFAEQSVGRPIPDLLTLEIEERAGDGPRGGIALADHPPKVEFVTHKEIDRYAKRANRIAVRHPDGNVVNVIEIVSPGNKSSRHAIDTFVEKVTDLIEQGVHVLIVDLHPPSRRDRQGLHGLLWDAIEGEPFRLPVGKPLTAVSYRSAIDLTAYVQPVAVGDCLPDMPLFLTSDEYVLAPLEQSYLENWAEMPPSYRKQLETPAI